MPLMGVGGDRAALSTEPLEKQDGKQNEQSPADGSQLRDPNARHGKNNLFYALWGCLWMS